jgi:ubiquinone biosynthesis protein
VKPFDFLTNAVRAKEILAVIAKYGFADLLDQLDLPAGLHRRLMPASADRRTTYERIRLAAEELGPTFVKAGQLLSMRPDALPHALILELRKLQSNVQPVPFEELRPVLVSELERDPSDIFASFNETPAASASLAQVYFARLHDGREVAVKIQRPHLMKTLQADFDLLTWLAEQLHHRVAVLEPYDLPSVVEEVKTGILRELDFENEARNQQYFTALNPHPDQVFAPAVVAELTTSKVLVMDRIEGRAVDEAHPPGDEAARIAANGASSILHQVLIRGFFHADPHAGNVLVTPDGRLCFLDWGMAGHLTRRLRYALADLFLAAVEQDAEQIVQIAANLGSPSGRADLRSMERDVTLALREDFNLALGRPQIGRAMLKLLFIFGRNGINITRDYSLMAKSVLSIEEVGRTLDPNFDLRRHARPVLSELRKERSGPRALARDTRVLLRSMLTGIQELPGELYRIIRRIEHDDLTIKFQHQGLENLDDALKTASNRITLGVVIGSLIVGSSLIITTQIPPYLFGHSAFGIIGYILSALLGLYVVYDIVRHGRHR